MIFPDWIEVLPAKERGQHRLKYILKQVALRRYGASSLQRIAFDIGCNPSTVFNAITRGQCSEDMAIAIETLCGQQEVRAEWLRDPLSINPKVTA